MSLKRMDIDMGKGEKKNNFFVKIWERCRSLNGGHKTSSTLHSNLLSKRKSWHCKAKKKGQNIAPVGCFTVYVGEERERFVIKIEYANHPLFKMLLEDAEMENGFNSEGPILLPCEVDFFYKVLAEMDSEEIDHGWSFMHGSCSPFPFNLIHRLGSSDMAKGYGSYALLTPSPFLKMNPH
ncbi:unnamed protein product [Ilex paraguariensis]|uniref:Small auxin up regulated protein n=1 Tax=Ilex paraguariensis TaxID=185542 RepID=A0ABC8UK85_9AQUA